MAILGLLDKFNGIHGSKKIRRTVFSVEATLEGKLEKDFVGGIDYLNPQKKLRQVINDLEGKYLDDIIGRATVENIALYMLFNLGTSEFTSLKITEGTNQYVIVFPKDIPSDYPTKRLFGIAASKLVRKKFQEACDGFTEVLKINPNLAEVYNCRGRCYKFLGRHDLALADYSMAIRINPNFGEAYRNRANIKYDLGQFATMMRDFNKAVIIMPFSDFVFNNRGWALQHFGRYQEAIRDHKKAIELDPQGAQAYLDIAEAYRTIGELKLARAYHIKGKHLESQQDSYKIEWRKIIYPK